LRHLFGEYHGVQESSRYAKRIGRIVKRRRKSARPDISQSSKVATKKEKSGKGESGRQKLNNKGAKEEQNSRQKAEAENRKQGKAPARKMFAKLRELKQ
jgi:hypothetical protein